MGDLNHRAREVQRLFRPKAGPVPETIGAELGEHAIGLPFRLGHSAMPYRNTRLQISLVFSLGQPLPAVMPIPQGSLGFFQA